MVVRGGQSVPVDGVITEGSAFLDESAITGESMPVERHVGDVQSSARRFPRAAISVMRASRVGDDSTLSRRSSVWSRRPVHQGADRQARGQGCRVFSCRSSWVSRS
ncbi:MAG: hypothetical protein ACLR4Z_05200 [Butyricicoccaceae bacterium]